MAGRYQVDWLEAETGRQSHTSWEWHPDQGRQPARMSADAEQLARLDASESLVEAVNRDVSWLQRERVETTIG
jgi:hypothetical protein